MLRQRHFRFRTDTGAVDATPTWGAAEDTNYVPGSAAFRLRFSIENPDAEATGSLPFQIYVSKNGGAYAAVTTSSTNGIKSIDAGSDADNTTIVIPRLTTPVWTPLAGAAIDLDFQRRRYYSSSSLADIAPTSVLSISRASIGYAKTAAGTLTSFGTGTLRVTDLGLLIEDARTNYCLQSQAVSNGAYWDIVAHGITVTADATASPDGTLTADLVIPTAAGAFHFETQTGITVAGLPAQATWSVYAKAGGYNFGVLVAKTSSGANAYRILVDLTTGAAVAAVDSGSPTNVTSGVETLGNGWFRLWIAMDAVTNADVLLGVNDTSTWHSFVGDGSSGVYFWGAQVEVGSFPSSYIPTTTTSATRATDAVNVTGALNTVLSALPHSDVMDLITLTPVTSSITWSFCADDTDGAVDLFTGSSGQTDSIIWGYDSNASSALGTASFAPSKFSTGVKVGTALATGARSIVGAGGTVASDANAMVGTSGNYYLGSGAASFRTMFGYIRRLTVWNSKLADATLQALTAP
jgi:hypothetical protein